MIDRVPDELWNGIRDIVQDTGIKIIPMEKKCKKEKWLSGEVFQQVAPPTKLRIEFPHETGLILSCAGKVGPPCRQSRGIDPPVTIRRGEGAQMKPRFDP